MRHILLATTDDAEAIAEVITAAAQDLTDKHGPGTGVQWLPKKELLYNMGKARGASGQVDDKVVGTLRLFSSSKALGY